jgi:hypothetical protein
MKRRRRMAEPTEYPREWVYERLGEFIFRFSNIDGMQCNVVQGDRG